MVRFGHRRGSVTFSIALLCAAPAGAAPTLEHCIVGESVFGCRSERDVAQITALSGDTDELKEKLADGVASGACRMFDPGERVFVTEVAADAGRAAVRRPDDTVSYWMPASWSRPIGECAAYATRRSVREKLGLAATTQVKPPEPDPAGTLARQRSPLQRPAPTSCTIKPVMTDAEIELCRRREPATIGQAGANPD